MVPRIRYVFVFLVLLAACSDDATRELPDFGNSADMATIEADAAIDLSASPDLSETPDSGSPDLAAISGWQDLTPIARGPRQETAVLALGTDIYVIGGFNDVIQMVPWVEVFDTQAGTWRAAADVPASLHHANAAVVDGQIWIVGFLVQGFAADGRIFSYDPDLDAWEPRGEMPESHRRGASVVGVVDGKIYLAGGINGGAVSLVSSYDPDTEAWETLTPLPREMDHGAGGVVDGKLIVAGGRDTSIGAHSSAVDIYDPAQNVWTSGAPMPTSRGGVAFTVLDDRLFVIGGEGAPNATGVFDAVEAYDLQADSWQTFDPMAVPRHGMGAAAVSGRIYVPGGADVEAFAAVDHHDVFVP